MNQQATTRAVLNVVRDTIARPDVPADPNAALPIAQAVAPIIAHATNSEPWYQSRVTWGAILAALAGVLGLFGVVFDIDAQGRVLDLVIALGPVIGAGIALYGRWAAKKPIGN